MKNNNDISKYMLDDDDCNVDLLTPELIEVDKKDDTNLISKPQPITEEKKEIIIEIKIDSIQDEDDLDFIDDDFEYIDEDEEDEEDIDDEEDDYEEECDENEEDEDDNKAKNK